MAGRAFNLSMTDEIIADSCRLAADMTADLLGDNLVSIILFGSCARGDYSADSDIDIALITKSGRQEDKNYRSGLAEIATEIAMRTFAVVNFICIPKEEFDRNRSWYLFYRNIVSEGKVLYGSEIL